MNKKEVLKFLAFVVAPAGIIAGTIYYAPKIKRWYEARKSKSEFEIRTEKTEKGWGVTVYKGNEYIGGIKGLVESFEIAKAEGEKIISSYKKQNGII